MRLLLIESAPGIAFELEDRLAEDGHTVVSCNDEFGGPCLGVTHEADCPLNTHVDLAILSRPEHSEPTLNEMGIVCARRHRVPIVRVDGPCAEADLAQPGEIERAAYRATSAVEHAFAVAIEEHLSEWDAVASVRRFPYKVAVNVRVPAGRATAAQRGTIADRARAVARLHDPFVPVVDVAVTLLDD
jgi:hypothetical protein